ncbi:hypothetical protein [Brucella intermedia]|uniref:hypothetical protein n=1 Tax=Brucella intermedia TaxID=94625 RepID=UPI00224942D8|nr:hypothetical protein [Brucella intermedia]
MVIVLVMQAAIDEIIDVIAMRHRFVTTVWAMDVVVIMTNVGLDRMASVGIHGANFDHMFINMIAMWMMQMTIMQVINVITVPDCGVTTTSAMLVVVRFMMG